MEHLEQQVRSACSELARRLRAGEACTAEEYLARFPEIAGQSDLALELIYTEHVVREELHQPVSADDWLNRFPQWHEDLRQLFEVHDQICGDQAGDSTWPRGRPPTEARGGSRPALAAGAGDTGRVVGKDFSKKGSCLSYPGL